MNQRPDRSTIGGSAYLDLRKLAVATGRPTDELIQLYGIEGFLDRLGNSPHSDDFVLKGGVLLAAYTDRRPTRDIDFAVDQVNGDLDVIRGLIDEVLAVSTDDGLVFDRSATSVESIRDNEIYPSIRANVTAKLSSANVRFHIDINIGDPVWPEPTQVEVPRLLDAPPLQVRGYSIEMILAEKIVTAIQRGTANTRWRDFLDIVTLSTTVIDSPTLAESIARVADHRRATIQPMSAVLDGFGTLAQPKWAAWRRKHQLTHSPEFFAELLATAIEFGDPLLATANRRTETANTTDLRRNPKDQ